MTMANINGSGAPTEQTVGVLGDIYTDSDTGIQYKCVLAYSSTGSDEDETEYRWVRYITKNNAGGSSGGLDDPLVEAMVNDIANLVGGDA